ncbi:MAG: multi-sensor hybrid histidine kinase [candidate division NC10 bacterium]|nr:multi-sensor hybrid histidine kinase [candidate division NC10 bacterium]
MSMPQSSLSPLPPGSGFGTCRTLMASFQTRTSGFAARLRDLLRTRTPNPEGLQRQPAPANAEADLPFLQAYFANIVELSEDAIISIDAHSRICLFNKGAEAIFGYQAAEMLGRPLDALIPPRFVASHRENVTRFAASADALRSMNERTTVAGVRKDGTEFPAEATISKFTVKGQTVMSVRLRDITRRKQAEAGLHRLAVLVESSDDAITGLGLDGAIVTWNGGAGRLYGYAAPEVVGRPFALLVQPDGHAELSRLFERVLRGEHVVNYETVGWTKAGAGVDVSLSVSPIKDSGGAITGISVIGRDITQRKRLEAQVKQAQKMEAVGTLAGGIAHDFNNLLGIIAGDAELAAVRIPNASPAQDHLRDLLAAVQRAKELVRQILTFSHPTHSERRPVALQTVVDEVKHLLRASLPSTIDFRQFTDAAPAVILADPTQIHQVLLNLCTNAEHAMRPRGGVVDLQLRTVDLDADFAWSHPPLRPGPHVKLTIRDTGHGMPHDVQARIFEPFFTTKPPGEGTGLGLAVVHGIVTGHGGAITVESAPGRGTRFDLYFPRCDEIAAAPPAVQAPLRGQGEHLLLVDDEAALVRLWTVALTDLGYRVTAHTSSRAALEAFRETPDAFDLVITDRTMPQMTGEALAQEILRLRPRLPIILCTGNVPVAPGARTRPLGVSATLLKPVSRLDLSLAIQRLLAERATPWSYR